MFRVQKPTQDKRRARGRPRKAVKRPRGRPKLPAKKKVGRPPWELTTDPDRFAIVATIILNRRFRFSERMAAKIALGLFEPKSQSLETLRWKAKKTLAILRSYYRRGASTDQGIKSNMWTTVAWCRRMRKAIEAAVITSTKSDKRLVRSGSGRNLLKKSTMQKEYWYRSCGAASGLSLRKLE